MPSKARNKRALPGAFPFAGVILAGALVGLLIVHGGSAQSGTPPKNTGQPTISGIAEQGRTLTTSNGTWSGTPPFTFQYRWLRCDLTGGGTNGVTCDTIAGETRKTYILGATDVGHRIRSRVIATNNFGTASFNSNATAVVKANAGPPKNTEPPTISGAPIQNNTLTASKGVWTGAPTITYTYQWRRCGPTGANCSSIAGATHSTYVLTTADVGSTVRVQVRASNSQGSATATSAPTAVVSKAEAPAGSPISINDVSLPNRLLIDRVSFQPSFLRSRHAIVARYRVTDSHNHPVVGAMVFVVGIPFGVASTPPEAATGSDGYVTFAIQPTRRAVRARGGIVFFVRARKPGERLIGGVSTRRLTFLSSGR
jgi:hypothetical protein